MHFPRPLHEGFVRIRRALDPRAAAAATTESRGLRTTTSRFTGSITGTVYVSNGHTSTAEAAATTAAAAAVATPVAATTSVTSVAGGPSAKLATTGPKARLTTTSTTGQVVTTPVTSTTSSATSAAASNSVQTGTKSNSHTGTIVGIIVAVIVVLALLAGFLFWRKRRSSRVSGGAFAKHHSEADFGTISPSSGGYGATKEKEFIGGFSGPTNNSHTNRQPSWDEAPSYRTDAPSPAYPPAGEQQASPFADQARVIPIAAPKPYMQQKGLPPIQEQQKPPVQSPFMDSPGQGQVYVVRNTFEPTQPDELIIYPGDRVQVLVQYDDGWALGINLDSGTPPSKGVFPFDCVAAPQPRPNNAGSPTGEGARALTPVSQQPPQLAPLARSDSPITILPASLQPGAPDGKVKRTSSLIASRDANLFVALGDVVGKDNRQP